MTRIGGPGQHHQVKTVNDQGKEIKPAEKQQQQPQPTVMDWGQAFQSAWGNFQRPQGGQLPNKVDSGAQQDLQSRLQQALIAGAGSAGEAVRNMGLDTSSLGNLAYTGIQHGVEQGLTSTLNNAIDKGVDNLMFNDKFLGLPQTPQYRSLYSGRYGDDPGIGSNNWKGDKKWLANGLLSQNYGTRGKTLGEIGGSLFREKASVSGKGAWGEGSANADISFLNARARGYYDIDKKNWGAMIGGEAELSLLNANANAHYRSPTVNVGGVPVGVGADVSANAFVGAKARGEASITLKGGPHVKVGGEAFAGASAAVQGSAGLMVDGKRAVGVSGEARAWAGVGAKFNLDAGFKDGKLKFKLGLGAALGIGASFDVGFDVDFKAIGNGIKKVAKKAVEGVGKFAKSVATKVADTAKKVADKVGDTAKKVFDKAKDIGKKAVDTVGNVAKKIGSGIKKVFSGW